MRTRKFWLDAAERSVRDACGAALAVIVTNVDGAGLLTVDWTATGSVSGLAALVSLLTSVSVSGKGDAGTAGVVRLTK